MLRIGLNSLACLLLAFALGGCAGIPTRHIAAPTQAEYIEVEYRKFVSGIYVNELGGKYVSIDCSFSSTMSGILPGGYSSNRYMAFHAVAPMEGGSANNLLVSPERLTVVVPKDLADVVFGLQHFDPIEVRGKARVVGRSLLIGGASLGKSLIIEAHLIRKRVPEPDNPPSP